MMKVVRAAVVAAVFGFFVGGCTRAPLKDRSQALRAVGAPKLGDDLGRADLVVALESHAAFLSSLRADTQLRFGKRVISAGEYAKSLEYIVKLSLQPIDDAAFFDAVAASFQFFEVYGGNRWGEVLLTSYFEPEIEGSLIKTPLFSTPLLGRPDDLIEISATRFDERLADVGTLRGRMWRDPDRKRDVVVPYYTRAEIESGALGGRHLELAWVHAVDAFFMQIQGSGTILLPGGRRLRLGYSDQNGAQYHSIGKFLTPIIPLEKMSLFTIESYLKGVSKDQSAEVMNKNPSYVFFEKIDGAPRTSLGNSVFAGRTIATDSRYFPKGALAFMKFKVPVFNSSADIEPTDWKETSRFVIDQDTGGAIRGGGRVDLFWGSGNEAKRFAGYMKDSARIFYLLPKSSLQELGSALEGS